jgi:vitamin B12 transporter
MRWIGWGGVLLLLLGVASPLWGQAGAVGGPRARSNEIVDRELLRSLPARTLLEVLQTSLGLDVRSTAPLRGSVGVRGGGPARFLIVVDGRRVDDPGSEAFDLELALPLDQIERIEILRGPSAAVFAGGAISGVIHVVTRDRTAWGFRGEEGGFKTRIWAGEAGVPLGRGKLQVAGERGSSVGHRPGTEWAQSLGSVRLQLPFRSGMWRADLGWGDGERGAEGFWGDLPAVDSLQVTSGAVTWRPADAPASPLVRPARFWLEPRFSWRRQTGSVQGEGWAVDAGSLRQGGELWGRVRPTERLRVGVGGAYQEVRQPGAETEEGWGWGGDVAWVNPKGIEAAVAFRWDRLDQWGDFATPLFSLGFPAGDGVHLRASWGTSFRPPRWIDVAGWAPISAAAPDLRPETAEELEVGLRWADREGFELDVAAFRRLVADEIVRSRPLEGGGPWRAYNRGRSRLEGVEGEARWDLGGGNRAFIGGLWLTPTPGEAPPEFGDANWAPLRDQWRVGGVHRLPDGAFVTLVWRQSRSAGEEAWGELDGRIAVPFLAGILYLDGRNVTKAEGVDRMGNPRVERNWALGYRLGSR